MSRRNNAPASNERAYHPLKALGLKLALGAVVLGSTLAAGVGIGRNMNNAGNHHPSSPYAFTTADLDQSYGFADHAIQVDPNNQNNQFYLASYSTAEGKGAAVAYVSIDGGKTWAYVNRPAANGVNKDATTMVIGASFAPGPDDNIGLHDGHATVFEVTYASQDGHEISVELAAATASGVIDLDVESAYGESPVNNVGTWAPDNSGGYTYSLPMMDGQGHGANPITVGEPAGGK